MTPEQSVQASIDLNSKLVVPIHWSSFTLANHTWTDPIERITLEAKRRGVQVATPRIGGSITLGESSIPTSRWWEDL